MDVVFTESTESFAPSPVCVFFRVSVVLAPYAMFSNVPELAQLQALLQYKDSWDIEHFRATRRVLF